MKSVLIISLALLIPFCSEGQENNSALSNPGSTPALVYLQTDKGVYQPGEDIWFKGYVMQASTLFLSTSDTTLYIQLFTPDSLRIIHQEKVLIQNGIAEGYIPLKKAVPSGNYLLAAFTRDSFENDTTEFKACRLIRIGNRETRPSVSPPDPEKTFQLSFMPEGGNLVAGLLNTLGFKACTANGKSLDFEGTLDEDGVALTVIKSTHKGMGKFLLIPQPGKKYTVQESRSGASFPLPEIQPGGVILKKVRQTPGQLTFLAVKTPETPLEKVWVSARIRGVTLSTTPGLFKHDSLVIHLPVAALPQGIVEFTLYDATLLPLAERLVYIHTGQDLTITTTLSKSAYLQKEKVTLRIKAEDQQGNPITAHLGISVYDQLFKNHSDQLNILSYAHLFTRINGNLDEPGYYFDPKNTDRLEALDLLLMTQGWRRYIRSSGETHTRYIPDAVYGTAGNKRVRPSTLLIFSPDRLWFGAPVNVSKEGTFRLDSENMITGNFYIKPLGKDEEGAKISFFDTFKAINALLQKKKIVYPLSVTTPETTDIPKLRGSILLNEIVVKAQGRMYSDPYMASLDSIATFDWNTDYVGKCNWLNCGDCLSGKKPVEGVAYPKFKDGHTPRHNIEFDPNDVIQEPYHYPKYTEEEIMKLFNIYRGKGFQVYKEFYSPDYAVDPASLQVFDPRSTLIWKPGIITDEKGEAVIEFYTSDLEGEFIGNIEGLNDTGLLGATSFSFRVTEPKLQ